MEASNSATAPWNFSWIAEGKLCASSWPDNLSHIRYFIKNNVSDLVTLSSEKRPPKLTKELKDSIRYHQIFVEEFESPTIDQIEEFLKICEKANQKDKAVCVHCRMGRGRTGVMAAAYLMKFDNLIADSAIIKIRMSRPGSIETWDQMRILKDFWDCLGK